MSASVGRNSAIMAMGTLASRLTGQVRTILLAAAIGTTGIAANAYQTGSTIPQVLFTILSGGVFNAVLVPQIVRSLKQKDAEDQLNKLITLSVVILVAVTGIMMACSTLFTSLYLDSSWNAAQRSLANSFTLWCMPQIFFYGLYTVLGQVLAAKNQFGAYAWSSTGANVISCIGFIAFIALYGNASHQPLDFWTNSKIALLAGSWTLGVAFQALVLFIPLLRSGYHWRPRLGIHGIGLRSMSSVAIWSLGIVLVNQLIGIVTSRVTNGAPLQGGDPYGIAGNSTYQNAFTLFILPYSLFAVSIATAMFPRMSEFIADGDYASARDELSSTLCNLTLIITFFTVAYLVEPVQITTALLPSVQPNEVNLMRVPLMVMCLANVPTSAILVLERTFFAFKDGRTPFWYTLAQNVVEAIVIVIGINVFPPRDWVTVVCCALAISNLVMLPIIYYLVHRHFPQGLDDKRIAMTAARTFTAALLALAAGALVSALFRAIGWQVLSIESMGKRWVMAVVQAILITGVAGGVYYGTLSALHTPEIAYVRGMVQRVLSKVLRRPIEQGAAQSEQTAEATMQMDALAQESLDAGGTEAAGATAQAAGRNPRAQRKPRTAASRSATAFAGAAGVADAAGHVGSTGLAGSTDFAGNTGRQRKPRVISSAPPSPFVPDDTAAGLDIIQDFDSDFHDVRSIRNAGTNRSSTNHANIGGNIGDNAGSTGISAGGNTAQPGFSDSSHSSDSPDPSAPPTGQPTQFQPRKRKQRHSTGAGQADSANRDEFGRMPIWAARSPLKSVPTPPEQHTAVPHPAVEAAPAAQDAVAPPSTTQTSAAHVPAAHSQASATTSVAATSNAAAVPRHASPTDAQQPVQHAAPHVPAYFPRSHGGPADTESVELHKIMTRAPQAAAKPQLTVPRLDDVPQAAAPKPMPYAFGDVARHAATEVHTQDAGTTGAAAAPTNTASAGSAQAGAAHPGSSSPDSSSPDSKHADSASADSPASDSQSANPSANSPVNPPAEPSQR